MYQALGDTMANIRNAARSARPRPTQMYPSLVNQVGPQAAPTPQSGGSLSSLGTLTTPFGGSTRYEAQHPGVDIANKPGTPVSDFVPGRVTESGFNQNGFGNSIVITDAQGAKHRYSHLLNRYVRVGDQVTAGQQIGTMGNTGNTYSESGGTGTHLDYRIVDAYNRYVNPFYYLGQNKQNI